ncbi:MAG: toll/interleukin-1 receptor domain-containing protein [Bacteroidales bacterium]|nr:toll/interleukin-1 receptor domain-containing protein [Bacteroidales bacterium]
MNTTEKPRPKVFISYSYDSKEHEEWVKNFTDKLRTEFGIDATIDKYQLKKTSNLNQIMVDGFEQSDYVIIVATRNYAKKAQIFESGVAFETKLATIINRDIDLKNKLIFIKREVSSKFNETLPFQFKDSYLLDFSDDIISENKYKELYYKIYGKDYYLEPELGPNPFEQNISNQNNEYEVNNETVFNIFEHTGFEPFYLSSENLTRKSIVIWPIVPRLHINLIHKAQIEIVRILFLLGWDTKIIIANCGEHSDITPNKQDVEFKKKLEESLKRSKIERFEISFLNQYFTPDFPDGGNILSKFVKISSSIKINQLTVFNTKDESYNDEAQKKINDRTTLKYISPLFTWAASIYEAEKFINKNEGSKPIIIAGKDEESQWSHIFREINSEIGAVFIPLLKDEDNTTFFQEGQKLVFSKPQLLEKLSKGNIDKWLSQSFIFLSSFPQKITNLDFCNSDNCMHNKDCFECMFSNGNEKLPAFVDKQKFVELIFPKINPA